MELEEDQDSKQNEIFEKLTETALRENQKEAVIKTRNHDTIIIMKTGEGKTLIAAQLAFEFLKKKSEKKVIFLTPTRDLADQQAKYFDQECRELYIICTGMGGQKSLTNIKQNTFSSKKRYEIAFCTPQWFLEHLKTDSFFTSDPCGIDLKEISLIVFDEVHHTRKDHPYKKICDLINNFPKEQKPRILGLTASPSFSGEQSKMQEEMIELQKITKTEYHDANPKENGGISNSFGEIDQKCQNSLFIEEVQAPPFKTYEINMKDKTDFYNYLNDSQEKVQNPQFSFFANLFQTLPAVRTNRSPDFGRELYSYVQKFEKMLQQKIPNFISPFKESSINKIQMKEVTKQLKKTIDDFCFNDEFFKIERNTRAEIKNHLEKLLHILTILYKALYILFLGIPHQYFDISFKFLEQYFVVDRPNSDKYCNLKKDLSEICPDFIENFLLKWKPRFASNSPILSYLKQKILEKFNEFEQKDPEGFKGILFVQKKLISLAIYLFIQSDPQLSSKIKCSIMCGQNQSSESGMTNTQKKQNLELFKKNSTNLLIATSVAEEGLDFPNCNVVFFFDDPNTATSFIQASGRARKENSILVKMQPTNKTKSENIKNSAENQRKFAQKINGAKILENFPEKIEHPARFDPMRGNSASSLTKFLQKFKLKDRYWEEFDQRGDRWGCTAGLTGFGQIVERRGAGPSKSAAKEEASKKLLDEIEILNQENKENK